jgi:diguanylate cyclase (GGDEF)-like protein
MFSEGAQLPQAVLCSNDLMALGIIETIKDTPVFDQIAVTGFDRYLEGEIYYPSLTTIARPKESVAYEGIKLLRELVLGGQTEPIHKNLDYQLYVGQSCGCQEPDYFDNKLFRCQSFERMHGEEEILAKLHSMEERIASEVSIEQIMEAIQIFLKRIDASAGQVYLENDILSGVACDYKQCRRLALDWSNDNCTDEIRVVMPLHYQQHQMGYCVMTGIGALFRYGVQENFFRSVSYALENCIQRLRYQDVNHRLQRLYRIDQLTEIYNRFGMEDKGQQFYHKNCMQHMNTIFIFCDINRLKYINDTYGHEAGDWVIRATGKALAKLQSEVSLPFRIGGDEFILLTTENSGVNEEVIRQSITEEGEEAPIDGVVEVSIGAVVAPWNEPEDLDRYLSKADEAMYEEKKRFHETYYDERRMERRKEQR